MNIQVIIGGELLLHNLQLKTIMSKMSLQKILNNTELSKLLLTKFIYKNIQRFYY